MAIRGSLREASLPDVLQLLAMGKKTGCLSVAHRHQFGYIYFERGRISYASIVNRRDRLGDLLVKHGLVTHDALEDAVSRQSVDRELRLGEILIVRRLITREQLSHYIRVQIEEAVFFLFTWTQGTFNFEADVRPDEQDLVVSINPESLLLEGARRIDEWSLIEKKVPSLDIVFEIDREKLDASDAELTPEQTAVVALVDAHRDVTAIVDDSGLGEFDVGKALYGLATAGFIRRIGRSRAPGPVVSDSRIDEHRNLGVAFYKAGMLDEAEREFRRVAELRPGDGLATFHLALVMLRRQQWEQAAEALRDLASRRGAPRAVHHNLAFALEQLGYYPEAREALAAAFERDPDPRSHLSRGVLAIRSGDLDAARADFAGAASLWGSRPRPAAWFHYAALAEGLAGDTPRAIHILSQGTLAHPRAASLFNNLAAALERAGRAAEAIQALERGLIEDATIPQLHKNLGDLHYRAGHFDEAMESYQRAVKHDPELGSDVFVKTANILYRRQQRADAVRAWERALALDPENAVARANLDSVRRAG